MRLLRNERGNTMILILGCLSIMSLLFIIIGSFANIFIQKEKSANNAEQASITASAIIFDSLQKAIDEYDASLVGEIDFLDKSINEKIRKKIDQLRPSNPQLSSVEIKHKAINSVLKEELSYNSDLANYITQGLNEATSKIPSAVKENILNNQGEISNTEIRLFNQNNRVEVITSTKFKALKFDKYFPDDKRAIKQVGEGNKFDFINELGGWEWHETFP
ncbi:hypothetical protein ACQKP0_21780 [Heyndrickxia sp. NPDC080065]|uniref:hypothetical protein n=1 Tax=Heyndrickxia sp. NPDC080065 TaxID=3390568 RepID=UPI003CFE4A84